MTEFFGHLMSCCVATSEEISPSWMKYVGFVASNRKNRFGHISGPSYKVAHAGWPAGWLVGWLAGSL